MKRLLWIVLSLICVLSLVMPWGLLPRGEAQALSVDREEAIQRLRDSLVGRGYVKTNRATNLVDFVRLDRATTGTLAPANAGRTPKERSLAFFAERRQSFGLTDPSEELNLSDEQKDRQDAAHLTFIQTYRGIPVFAGALKTHFNARGELRAVNGEVVPDISIDPVPTFSKEDAKAEAIAKIQNDRKGFSNLSTSSAELYVYRTGFVQGVAGENHLAWRVEVTNGADVLEFVFIDAHSGEFVDQITGKYEALNRFIYDGENLPVLLPPSFPYNPFWSEGQPFPTSNADANSIILTSKETYDLYKNALGRDSFDNAGSPMISIFNSGPLAGNAQSRLYFTLYGTGFASDDVVAHEWTHSYSALTHGLIYAWQPGALNEAYSDIVGETVDLLNGRGLDSPVGRRQDDACSLLDPNPRLNVTSPVSLQGEYKTGTATFGPQVGPNGISGKVVLINDGMRNGLTPYASLTDGCQAPFRNAEQVRGNIALIDSVFYECTWTQKVRNAQLSGAIAVIMANSILDGETPRRLLEPSDSSIVIPVISVGYSDGQRLRKLPPGDVRVNITAGDVLGSYRWLLGEETILSPSFRDMWCPVYDSNPGKTSDSAYWCYGGIDEGGVHQNSGIPNHAYALLVDGGTYNGQTIQALGLTKALHIYLRAMTVYQTPTTDFADHAEALEASAADLVGVDLPSVLNGQLSGEIITQADVEQVHKATLAVELRTPPTQCTFPPVLAKDPPDDSCGRHTMQTTLLADDFETDPAGRWSISRDAVDPSTFIPRDWAWVHSLPDGRSGSGFFALDPLDDCSPFALQTGVLHLDSPEIIIPRPLVGGPHVSFEHWIATEATYDGGQLLVSVNSGPFRLISQSAFLYNAYNKTISGYGFGENPQAGQPAFSGTDLPTFKGSWGTSIVDLTGYAKAGDRVKLRWDLGTDQCYGTDFGWYLDNVRVYACQP